MYFYQALSHQAEEDIMSFEHVNIAELATAIRSCKGRVCLLTAEGDCLNANSILSAIVGLSRIVELADRQPIRISCENPEDQAIIDRCLSQ